MDKKIEVVYLNTSEYLTMQSLLSDATDYKDRILAKLGITRNEGESHVDAWGRHLHEINGLQFTKPYHKSIVDVISSDRSILRFMFLLA